jgi:hypothetical protein
MNIDQAIYVLEPDVPIGLTIDEYRRLRPRRLRWWRRVIRPRTGEA